MNAPLRILVLNPNTSDAVTDRIRDAVSAIARPTTDAVVARLPEGPLVLESYYDEALAAPLVLRAVDEANREGYDAIIVAAFCDPALEATREISQVPVFLLEETTLAVALMLGNRFGILTEQPHKVSVKRQHVRKHGLESRLASIRPLCMGVTEIAEDPERAVGIGVAICRRMVEEDGAEVIILGCAGLAGQATRFERELGVPVLDPMAVTFKVVEALAEIGVRHSKVGLYATPASRRLSPNG